MPDPRVIELRRHLRERFPAAHPHAFSRDTAAPAGGSSSLADRQPAFGGRQPEPAAAPPRDRAGSLPLHPPPGAITEIVPAGPASGLSLVLAALLDETPSEAPDGRHPVFDSPRPLVLVDARDRFDPDSFPAVHCARLLWIRCRETRHALEAADLLLRDGNLPLVLLDLAALPARELRRIHRSSWHRLRQLAADRHTSLLVLAPAPTVPCAALRLTLNRRLGLDLLDLARPDALLRLRIDPTRLRHAQ